MRLTRRLAEEAGKVDKCMSKIKYKLKRSTRARQVRISVSCEAGVIVTAPRRLSIGTVEEFVQAKMMWIRHTLSRLQSNRRDWITPEHVKQESFAACRSRAAKFIRERVAVFNAHYKFSHRRISVKSMTSRWGSCSKNGNLNFHYRLLFLPIELADYVVVHELCHLREMNHSRKFWALVIQTIPDYRESRNAIKSYSLG